jgi:hypothetical protein
MPSSTADRDTPPMSRAAFVLRALPVIASVVVLLAAATIVRGADSPLGDRAGAWPTAWTPYLLADGSLVRDPIGDVGCGTGYCDVSGGSAGSLSSVYWATDGTNVFFRLRVSGDPRNAAAGGFRSTAYVLQIATDGQLVAAVGLNGKPANRDFVYISNADGTAYSELYAYPFDSSAGELSGGARAAPDGAGQFFVDWQVPIARITQRTGGAVTATTPIQLFFGTSQAANLAVINKDYMIGNAVDFSSSSTIVFVPPAVSGGAPPPTSPQAPGAPPAAPGATTAPGQPGSLPLLPNTATGGQGGPAGWVLITAVLIMAALFAAGRTARRHVRCG